MVLNPVFFQPRPYLKSLSARSVIHIILSIASFLQKEPAEVGVMKAAFGVATLVSRKLPYAAML